MLKIFSILLLSVALFACDNKPKTEVEATPATENKATTEAPKTDAATVAPAEEQAAPVVTQEAAPKVEQAAPVQEEKKEEAPAANVEVKQ